MRRITCGSSMSAISSSEVVYTFRSKGDSTCVVLHSYFRCRGCLYRRWIARERPRRFEDAQLVGGWLLVNAGRRARPSGAAAWTQRPRFTGKRDQPIEAAVATAKPREPAGEPATPKKTAKFLLDEAGQPFPVAQAGGLR